MRRLPLSLLILVVAAPVQAQRLPYSPVSGEELTSPPRLAYQAVDTDAVSTARAQAASPTPAERQRRWPRWALLDRFEHVAQRGRDGYGWDFSALAGGARNRLWLGSVGEGEAWRGPDYLEFQALYSRNVGGPWDLNAGVRWDAQPRPNRFYATAGAQYDDGEALWLGAFAYLSHQGELSARLAGYYDWELVSSLFLQPSLELDASGEDVPELGIGRGFTYAEAGLRLRYELEDGRIAPYVGLSWSSDLGRTARLTRAEGEDPEARSLVLGLRSSF
jgi:copper resistance protein B